MKNAIPIVVQTINKHSFWVESIFDGLRKVSEKSDYKPVFFNNIEALDKTECAAGDSIIVIGYAVDWLQKTIDALIAKGYRPIIVNAWIPPEMLKYCSGVFFNLEESVQRCLQYLAAAERKKIVMLGTNQRSLADRLKEEVFRKYAPSFNKDGSAVVLPGKNPLSDCIDEFLELFTDTEVDAVICSNDTVAIYLINRMIKDGFKIPEDLYVIGIGNSRLGQSSSIPLSSVHLDYEELGRQAFGIWRYLQKSDGSILAEVSIPYRFIPRASTADFTPADGTIDPIRRPALPEKKVEIYGDAFYEDIDVQRIIKFEVFLRSCDEIDYWVLGGLLQGKNDAKMAEQFNITDRAIRYRINKMTKKLGVQTREEIVHIIRELELNFDAGSWSE